MYKMANTRFSGTSARVALPDSKKQSTVWRVLGSPAHYGRIAAGGRVLVFEGLIR